MRLMLRLLLVMVVVVALEPATSAVAAKTSITATTNSGRQCLVYTQGYIEGEYFKTNGVMSCTAQPTYGMTMERLSVILTTSGVFLPGSEYGSGQAYCQWVNYCEASKLLGGTVPGMTYGVWGEFTLDPPDTPVPERWASWPSQCRRAAAERLVCNLSVSATRPLT